LLYLAEFFQVSKVKVKRAKGIEDKLYKQLRETPLLLQTKSNMTQDFLKQKVFAPTAQFTITPENWGTILRRLRNFITHRDRSRPDFVANTPLYSQLGITIIDWNDLEKLSFGHFCQYIHNGMFEFYPTLSTILYDLKWIPGPYKSGMFTST